MSDAVQDRTIENLKVGEEASFEVEITEDLMSQFAKMSGDVNPLHTDESFAKTTKFGRRVVYGQLLNAFFSRLIGHYFPGKRALYLSQNTKFSAPAFVGDRIRVRGKITGLHESVRLMEIETTIHRVPSEELLVTGKAQAMVQ